MSNFGKDVLCFLVQTHVHSIHQRPASCRIHAYKYPMDNEPIIGGFQVKVLVVQGWARVICHGKRNRVVKVNNQLVLYVANLGAIIDVMLAISTSLCD
jgi:hypothetical protein